MSLNPIVAVQKDRPGAEFILQYSKRLFYFPAPFVDFKNFSWLRCEIGANCVESVELLFAGYGISVESEHLFVCDFTFLSAVQGSDKAFRVICSLLFQ